MIKIALILLTYNAENDLPHLMPAIMQQTVFPDHILVIDSSSTDKTRKLLERYPVQLHTISQKDFDHGGTRKLATQLVDADVYIYLTQDAYPATPDSFTYLLAGLNANEKIGCAYGRQLPKTNATPLAAHARIFNYSEKTHIRSFKDKDRYGIKTCFNSDSFAAYKKTALDQVGNFPSKLMTGEDTVVAAKMLKHGYQVAYVAEAMVYHSHNLTLRQEFHRYFSTGVLHAWEKWLLDDFSGASREGFKFVKSELKYLIRHGQGHLIPYALLSTLVKLFSYRLGLLEKAIPNLIKRHWGINKGYWTNLA